MHNTHPYFHFLANERDADSGVLCTAILTGY